MLGNRNRGGNDTRRVDNRRRNPNLPPLRDYEMVHAKTTKTQTELEKIFKKEFNYVS